LEKKFKKTSTLKTFLIGARGTIWQEIRKWVSYGMRLLSLMMYKTSFNFWKFTNLLLLEVLEFTKCESIRIIYVFILFYFPQFDYINFSIFEHASNFH